MTVADIYSESFIKAIDTLKGSSSNAIFVLLGDTSSIDISSLEGNVLDSSTFVSTRGSDVFSKEWFGLFFPKMVSASSFLVLSYAQYSYIADYLRPDFFQDRVIIIQDNIRQIFPLADGDFIADTQEGDSQIVELPVYQADQFIIEGKHYYSVKTPSSTMGRIFPVFTNEKELSFSGGVLPGSDYIDPYSDNQSLDLFFDSIISSNKWNASLCLKHYDKQPVPSDQASRVKALNYFLGKAKGEIYSVVEESHSEIFEPSDNLLSLLRTYWGEKASFRNITIYKNPDVSNETIELSQGKVVQTVIDEYENVRNGRPYRDVFLTAPTGAGKSLLFQLPAFYISAKGDVTIVVSPLIALMKDQVNAIIGQRGFKKAAYINSEVSLLDRDKIIDDCKNGNIDILYMAPELLMSYDITYFIGDRHLGLMVIDEAHLITTWGRDFRVDYWYIGNHIRKIRKYTDQEFPMIAVTATAVYGGDKNDMVFDTVDSLVMHTPHYFIGKVKRDDIEFIINNYEPATKGFDTAKLRQTSQFIKDVNELGFKTLVYAPYTDHVRKVATLANDDGEIAVQYYSGTLDALSKEQAERAFRSGDRRVMICTKAFGMGVDIPDIQVVYHHAPSGLLPDYVQEIGRAARDPKINGYAVLNYSTKDQKYSKQLYGMSSLKLFQLKAVLKKVYDTYRNNGNKRNMLLSVDDFAFAFNDSDDIETKVKTALMMIEKDYLAKDRYNVLLARPKQLFTKVFAQVSEADLKELNKRYKGTAERIVKINEDSVIVRLDLNFLWSNFFSEKSFPMLKRDYYCGHLFDGITVSPKLKISYTVEDIPTMFKKVSEALDIVKSYLSKNYSFFEKEDLVAVLKNTYNERTSQQLASFILSSYSGETASFNRTIEADAFLQVKHTSPRRYRVFGNRYEGNFAQILKLLSRLFEKGDHTVSRFMSKENSLPYVRIANLIEILDVGSSETLGGEAPMIFIRLNNPEKVRFDSRSTTYTNLLFDKTKEKHSVSTEIMDHFFTRSFSNEERWDFIEDFFLGENNEELKKKYPGGAIERINVIDELSTRDVENIDVQDEPSFQSGMTYPPRKGEYRPKDHLTLEVEGKEVTYTMAEWIEKDPLTLHKAVKDKVIYAGPYVYQPLMSNISKHYPEYYTKVLGTKKMITMPGYREPVMAELAMKDDPIRFYKWWNKDREQVYLSLREKIALFDAIANKDKSVLLVKDLKFMSSGK